MRRRWRSTLLASRPLLRAILRGLARRGLIEQRVAFYGADPASLELIRKTLDNLDLPHVRFLGVADDRPKGEWPKDLEFIGGIDALIEQGAGRRTRPGVAVHSRPDRRTGRRNSSIN